MSHSCTYPQVCESDSEIYGWLGNEVMNSRMEKNKTISKAAKGKKSPKRLVNRKSISAFSKKPSSTPVRVGRPSTKKNSTDDWSGCGNVCVSIGSVK